MKPYLNNTLVDSPLAKLEETIAKEIEKLENWQEDNDD